MLNSPTAPTISEPRLATLAEIRGLRIETAYGDPIVQDVDLTLGRGEVLGIVGESGSGKTTTALAMMGYASTGIRLAAGTLDVDGKHYEVGDLRAMAALRGAVFSYVPQSPGTALNPTSRVGTALVEMLRRRTKRTGLSFSRQKERETCLAMLESVGLQATDEFLRRFPHQLSGGQQQRVCIAIALMSGSKAIILDEPTTGLDVVTQAAVLRELALLKDQRGVAMVYISHDLAVVAQVASRVAVMYAGRVVEIGATDVVLHAPAHPYTRGLIAATPDHRAPKALKPMKGAALGPDRRSIACSFSPRCERVTEICTTQIPPLDGLRDSSDHRKRCFHPVVGDPTEADPLNFVRGVSKAEDAPILVVDQLRVEHRSHFGRFVACNDISFSIGHGECLALVGESGSGKSTLARAIIGLQARHGGSVRFRGEELAMTAAKRTAEQRRRLQMVFQNPQSALNPREIISTAIERGRGIGADSAAQAVPIAKLMELVQLPSTLLHRYPRELSGGERQRVCIARALACRPDVVVCDEITSALDVSVQAAVLKLLHDLRRDLGLAMLFITHDMGVVANLANRVIVLNRGSICEAGPVAEVLEHPKSSYAQNLIAAAPTMARDTVASEASVRPGA